VLHPFSKYSDPDSAGAEETTKIAKELDKYLRQIQGSGHEIILMGDLNCCLSDLDRKGERGSNPSSIALEIEALLICGGRQILKNNAIHTKQ
jgi:exonuclease III